jgi:CubicO group peptidase (beta-lactamase class C family)
VQLIRAGQAAETYCAGLARLSPAVAVTPDTVFRTASVAKMALSLLVFRLQTLGELDVTRIYPPSGARLSATRFSRTRPSRWRRF